MTFLPRSLHSARVVFQLILIEGRRKEAGVRSQSWELSMEQGEQEVEEARVVSSTVRGSNKEADMSGPETYYITKCQHQKSRSLSNSRSPYSSYSVSTAFR